MKLLLRAGIIIFGCLALGTFLGSLVLVQELYTTNISANDSAIKYHFALYLPENRNSFFNEIIRGVERAAGELNAAVSIHSIDPAKNELEMASYTGVDGFIVCPYLDDSLARQQLYKISSKNMPVVIINHNVLNEQPWPFIGTNNFDVGRRMGELAGISTSGAIRLAIVYSEKAPGIFGERELVEMGISTALAERLAASILSLKTNLNPLDVEGLLYNLFRGDSSINVIIFTDSNDTIAAAQALVDMNLVGRVQIIGFGDDRDIIDNIKKGIIAGTVVTNPDRIGYEALRSLEALRSTGYTSASIDTGIMVITRDTL